VSDRDPASDRDRASHRAGGGRPARFGSIAALAIWAAVVARVITEGPDRELIPWYVAGLALFLVAHVVVLWWPPRSRPLLHVAFGLQAALVLVLLSFDTDIDILTALLALECYQVAVAFTGRVRVVWVMGLVTLIPVALAFQPDWLEGLSEAFVPMVAGVVLAMYAVVSADLVAAGDASKEMVAELRETQRGLEAYAGQAEELAAIDARSRVARELQGSVSATVADVLAAARAAREARGVPADAAAQLARTQELAQRALAQMRAIIAELRPPVA
jgi:signal transduction histidine kinase